MSSLYLQWGKSKRLKTRKVVQMFIFPSFSHYFCSILLLFDSILTCLLSSAFCRSSSVKKREGDLAAALSRASTLETQLNKSEAALTTALSQNASLSSELTDFKSQLAKVGTAAAPSLVLQNSGSLSHVDLFGFKPTVTIY